MWTAEVEEMRKIKKLIKKLRGNRPDRKKKKGVLLKERWGEIKGRGVERERTWENDGRDRKGWKLLFST